MMNGAVDLLEEFKSPLGIAEALLEGKVHSWKQEFMSHAGVDSLILQAAKIRIEWRRESASKTVHTFIPGPGTYIGSPEETCELCGSDPRNKIHRVKVPPDPNRIWRKTPRQGAAAATNQCDWTRADGFSCVMDRDHRGDHVPTTLAPK